MNNPMSADVLAQAVAAATQTHAIVFGPGAVRSTGELFAHQFPGASALLVADQNTYAAAGDEVLASLRAAGVGLAGQPYVFPGKPTLYCSYDNTVTIKQRWQQDPDAVVVAVASGTLNDLVKLAAGELGRAYLEVCTAASVDGYTAFGASIEQDGFKITHPCPAPVALVADTTVMADAPARLTATGYGDLIEKIPAGADWILAEEVGVEPILSQAWDMVQPASRAALGRPEQIAAGDHDAIAELAQANLLSGLAMQAAQSSRPASGAGHLFSHVWEMEGHGLSWDPPLSHGFKVGIGTIASCALWQACLALDLRTIDLDRVVPTIGDDDALVARCQRLLSDRIRPAALAQSRQKLVTGAAHRAHIERLVERWPSVQQRCREQLIGPDEVVRRLAMVGAPHHPSQIGIDAARLQRTYLQAQLIRSRYTILDALAELGLLEPMVRDLFAPDGFWGRNPWPAN
ncbi:MAG: sn-glycerol-1-phosphate dehydrogenase [Propionibacteriaceae bacterium]|nr:sn-glycerol-1-phosphate dehydrogenase [Propionibacteriaceae bacterium]